LNVIFAVLLIIFVYKKLQGEKNIQMKIPIVLTAFGTTTKAFNTYAFIEKIIRKNFPGHEIHWAYSSRIVRERMAKRSTAELKHPHQVLENLGFAQK